MGILDHIFMFLTTQLPTVRYLREQKLVSKENDGNHTVYYALPYGCSFLKLLLLAASSLQ